MVVTIEKAAGSSLSALQYNERKVSRGDAEIVAFANLESLDRDSVKAALSSYENWSKGARNLCFHASVNPGAHDACSEEQVLSFIAEMMGELGYREQPYLVYRHHDIAREHYHVVSVRSDRDGNKIRDYYERKRVEALMRSRGKEYGFEVGNGPSVGETESLRNGNVRMGNGSRSHRRFNPAEPVTAQIESIVEWALGYNFTSVHQFQLILDHYGVRMSEGSAAGGTTAAFQGLDLDGKPVTGIIHGSQLGCEFKSSLEESIGRGSVTHSMRQRERVRVENLVRSCFVYSHSRKHLENMLARHGVQMDVFFDDSGKAMGLTFIDHVTRTAFKGSELHGVLTPGLMREAVESGRWRDQDRGENKGKDYVRESRKNSAQLRNAMASCAMNLGKGGSSGTPGTGHGTDQDEREKQRSRSLTDANISISNVAVANVASKV